MECITLLYKKKSYKRFILLATVCYLAHCWSLPQDQSHLRWDWNTLSLDAESIAMKIANAQPNFVIGASTAEYQILGEQSLPDSELAHAEPLMECLEHRHKKSFTRSGNGCDGWNKRFEDIELLEQLNMNGYRFSIDWSKIVPREGEYNLAALRHYKKLCQTLKERGYTIMVTLHHFVIPQWFAEKGGFEHEHNISYFIEFCETVYNLLAEHVDLWCTINEPGVYILQGYIRGVMPPFKSVPFMKGDWAPHARCKRTNVHLAAQVLKNLLKAHIEVYNLFHAKYQDSDDATSKDHAPQVGFAHQYLYLEPFHKAWNPLRGIESVIAATITQWINLSIIDACRTGVFSFTGASAEKEYMYDLVSARDYIGLNYYAHVFFDITRGKDQPGRYAETIMTDMPYEIYAEGLYRAIADMARLGTPIYITENGIADHCFGNEIAQGAAQCPHRRSIWINRYLFAVAHALEQGYDVRGYFYWSLMDNWEWDMSYGPRFGLYHVDFDHPDKPRTLRDNAQPIADIAALVCKQ